MSILKFNQKCFKWAMVEHYLVISVKNPLDLSILWI